MLAEGLNKDTTIPTVASKKGVKLAELHSFTRPDALLFRRALASRPDAAHSAHILITSDAHDVQIMIASNRTIRPSAAVERGLVHLANPALDAAWCPFMTGEADASFIVTCRSQPLQLFDVADGALRGTYKAFNKMDELTYAQSVCWSRTRPSDVVAGYGHRDDSNVHLRVFDVSREGDCTASHESKVVRGIAAAVAEWKPFCVAWGSLLGGIELVDYRRAGSTAAALWSHTSGVTQLVTRSEASPFSEHYIFSGARKGDENIALWDVRNVSRPLTQYKRSLVSHQAASFAVQCTHDSDMILVTSCHEKGIRVYRRDGLELPIDDGGAVAKCAVGVTALPSSQLAILRGSLQYVQRDRYEENAAVGGCADSEKQLAGAAIPPQRQLRFAKRSRQCLSACSDDDAPAATAEAPSSVTLLQLVRD